MEIAVAHSLGWGSAGIAAVRLFRLAENVGGEDRAQLLEDFAMNWRTFEVSL
jgi:hypothetical protein